MREIKFRAWDMSDPEFGHYMESDVSAYDEPFTMHAEGEIVLMQYTGLEDGNGIGIYEGDFLKIENNFDLRKSVEVVPVMFEHYQWLAGEAPFRPLESMKWNENQSIAVVGNIYENPELLGNQK